MCTMKYNQYLPLTFPNSPNTSPIIAPPYFMYFFWQPTKSCESPLEFEKYTYSHILSKEFSSLPQPSIATFFSVGSGPEDHLLHLCQGFVWPNFM